jgi:pyruvate/2-oxoglutarate dehydrogenase complex dihydrolipoamide dehydrogenase (E3) component
VTYTEGKEQKQEVFDTVFHAIGRDPIIGNLGLDKVRYLSSVLLCS